MTLQTTRCGRHALVMAAILAVVALVGSACRLVQPPGVLPDDPTGVLESVEGGRGNVTVTGWATQWDRYVDERPDESPIMDDRGPIRIVVLVDGEWAKGVFPADVPRPDVDRYLISKFLWSLRQKAMGYGFDFTVPADRGETGVCVVALNQYPVTDPLVLREHSIGQADHVVLGCRTVTVS